MLKSVSVEGFQRCYHKWEQLLRPTKRTTLKEIILMCEKNKTLVKKTVSLLFCHTFITSRSCIENLLRNFSYLSSRLSTLNKITPEIGLGQRVHLLLAGNYYTGTPTYIWIFSKLHITTYIYIFFLLFIKINECRC